MQDIAERLRDSVLIIDRLSNAIAGAQRESRLGRGGAGKQRLHPVQRKQQRRRTSGGKERQAMADVINLTASHSAMRAHAARRLKIPSVAGLIVDATGLHPVILPAPGRIKKVRRGIDVTGGGKQIQFFRLLALKREPAYVAGGTQRKKVKRNRGAAKKHVLIVAVTNRHARAAQLYRIRDRKSTRLNSSH